MRNHSYENDFDLHGNETASRTHFHKKGFALRLVLAEAQESAQENSEMAYWYFKGQPRSHGLFQRKGPGTRLL